MFTPLRAVLVAGALRSRARVLPPSRSAPRSSADSSFAAMQERGKMAMGVDQTTSTHTFDALPNGGRIELLRDLNDSLGIAQIRAHLRLIQHAFQAGDFSTPQFVHMQTMPGTAVMAKKRDVIAYSYHDLPRGGEVVMTTTRRRGAGCDSRVHGRAADGASRDGRGAIGEQSALGLRNATHAAHFRRVPGVTAFNYSRDSNGAISWSATVVLIGVYHGPSTRSRHVVISCSAIRRIGA